MKKRLLQVGVTVCSVALLFSGCTMLGIGEGDKTLKGAAIGTGGGAAIGAVAGATQGSPGKGALWGAVGGAVLGTVAGVLLDRQEEQLRQAGINAQRDEKGALQVNLSDETLAFDTGEATIKPEGMVQLNKIASILQAHPENRISIAGYTDAVGDVTSNLHLSQLRADSVKRHLLQRGVSAHSIVSSVGYGESYPIADNSLAAGRAQNRRVELGISVNEAEARKNS